ncbi:MAG: hypothetical protein JXJ17_11925, partial [Anaerolineae bacterium]|nr:hypothetical protein [Anaerolineae bacterium]
AQKLLIIAAVLLVRPLEGFRHLICGCSTRATLVGGLVYYRAINMQKVGIVENMRCFDYQDW